MYGGAIKVREMVASHRFTYTQRVLVAALQCGYLRID